VECGSGLALFERSEFSQTPHSTSTAGSPKRQRRGADSWGAFLLVTFLLRKRKVTAPPGAYPAGDRMDKKADAHHPKPYSTPLRRMTPTQIRPSKSPSLNAISKSP
jgi:hypothetical protein